MNTAFCYQIDLAISSGQPSHRNLSESNALFWKSAKAVTNDRAAIYNDRKLFVG